MNFETARGYHTCLEFLRSFELPIQDRSKEVRPATIGHQVSQLIPPGPPLGLPPGLAHGSTNGAHDFRYGAPTVLSQSSQRQLPSASQEHLSHPQPVSGTVAGWVPSSAQPTRALTREPSITYVASQEGPGPFNVPFYRPYAPTRASPGTNTQPNDSLNPTYFNTSLSQNSPGASQPTDPGSVTQYHAPNSFPHPISVRSADWRPVSAPETQAKPPNTESLGLDDLLPPVRILPFPEKKDKLSNRGSDAKMDDSQDSIPHVKATKKATKPRKRAVQSARAQSVQSTLTGHASKPGASTPGPGRGKAKATRKTVEKVPPPIAPTRLSSMKKQVSEPSVVGITRTSTSSLQAHPAQNSAAKAVTKTRAFSQADTRAAVAKESITTPAPVAQPVTQASQWVRLPMAASKSEHTQAALTEPDVEVSSHVQVGPPGAPTKPMSLPRVLNQSKSTQAPSVQHGEEYTISPLGEVSGNARPPTAESLATTRASPTPPANPLLPAIQPDEILSSIDSWIRRYQDLPVPQPHPKPKDQLAEYAAKSDKERARIVDNMICECLQDENFIKLARDVEGSWKRIGLGF